MGTEENVEKQIAEYQKLAEGNKNIDMASLMINALETARQDEIAQKKKRRAYLISVAAPPLGLFFAARYWFSDKPDGKYVARNCLILTLLAGLVAWLVGRAMLSSGGPSVSDAQLKQIESINADTLKQLTQ